MSKKVVLSADEATATVTAATMVDVLTTAISTDSAVLGTYGLIQRGLIFAAGMGAQNARLGRGWNFLKAD